MSEPFVPPYPKPHRSKLSQLARFVWGWQSWIHTLFEKSYRMKMGEIRLPGIDFFIPNEPDLVKRIMADPAQFPKHHLLKEVLDPLIGNSVFSINGEAWKNARAMVNPAFAHTHLKKAFATMDAAVSELLQRLHARDLNKPQHIDPLMTHVTADIIFRTILSHPLSEAEAENIFEAFERYQKYVQPCMILRSYGLPIGLLRHRLHRAASEIHAVFAPIVQARHTAFHAGDAGPDDILRALLEAKHPITGAAFTYPELLDQVCIIFLAGHETSASALSWALYLVANCPEIQEAMVAEGAAIDTLNADSIRQLTLTKNVFQETMRLYPPVSFFMREVKAETTLRDKCIKPGALLVIAPWLMQRSDRNFPCPHAFMPERFADPAQAEACKHAYLPFGQGPRICIGAGFAQQEAVLVLARVLQHFRLATANIPEPVSRLTLRAKHGIYLRFEVRDTK